MSQHGGKTKLIEGKLYDFEVEYVYDAFDQLTGKRVATQFTLAVAPTYWARFEVFVWADGQR